MRNTMIRLCLIAVAAAVSVSASAGTVTFGQYEQLNSKRTIRYLNKDVKIPGKPVTYASNDEIFSINGSSKGTSLVKFDPLINGIAGSGVWVGTSINAYLSLDAFSTTGLSMMGSAFQQYFDGSMSFTSVVGGKNLLTINFTNAVFNASSGAFSFTVNGNSMTGTASYTSDVFATGSTNDFAVSGSGTSTGIALAGLQPGRTLRTFNASTSATFSTVIPEPAALALFGFGIVGLGFARRRAA